VIEFPPSMTDPGSHPRPAGWHLWLPRLLVIGLVLHLSRGLLPFVPAEGDDLGVVNGLEAWRRNTGDFAEASYLYAIQPGSYWLVAGLERLTGVAAMTAFGAASAAGAAGFIALAAFLLADLTGLRPAWAAVALLLAQETTTAAFYANTNALAGCSVMGALLLARRARTSAGFTAAGLLLGLGGWFRLDSLTLSPVVLLLRLQVAPPRRAFLETARVAAASLVGLALACAAIGLSPQEILGQATTRGGLVTDWNLLNLYGWSTLGYVATAAALAGLAWMAITRRWLFLALALTGVLLPLAPYARNFTSQKYLYYAVPFLLLPLISWLQALWAGRAAGRRATVLILAAIAAESLVGLQTSAPEFRRYDPASPGVLSLAIPAGGRTIRAGFAEGELLPSTDGPRLRGGQLWAPGFWHREKTAMQQAMARFDERMSARPPAQLLTSTYLAFRLADGWLRGHGFRPEPAWHFAGNPASYTIEYRRDAQSVVLAQINHTPTDAIEFNTLVRLGPSPTLFLNDRGAIGFSHLTAGTPPWQLLSDRANGLIALYEFRRE
jgi:MFS family permease